MLRAVRKRTAELLEANRPDDRAGQVVDIFLVCLILTNVLVAMLATVPQQRARWGDFMTAFEIFTVAVFSVEYVLRLWSCVDKPRFAGLKPWKARLKWVFSPLGLIDLAAILPFYILYVFPANSHPALLLRLFRGLRLLRILKLTRYSSALRVFRNVLKEEAGTLMVVTFVLAVALVLSAWGIFVLESEAQPEAFGSIPQSLWWAVISLSTVGYGDVVPMTTGGRFFGAIVAIIGVGMAALPAGILASGFTSEMRRRENAFRRALSVVLADGKLTDNERDHLDRIREELGLSEDEAHSLYLDARRAFSKSESREPGTCPHCGKELSRH